MKAIVYREYGLPDVLELEEVQKPTAGDDEVLVKVHAASVNSWDWDLLRGKPLLFRLLWGVLRPKHEIPGADIAGRVEAVGRTVTEFQPGDEVFGDLCECGWGGFAEYACARESALALKPANMTFEQAAAVPQAAVMALQGTRDYAHTQPGKKVLINGAGGGVGTFAVQMAKLFGAEVTGVDSTSKLDMLRSIGADHVIDYTQEDFTRNGQCYDLILDNAVHRPISDYKRALGPEGIHIVVGGSMARVFQLLLLRPWLSMSEGKKMVVLAHDPNKDLAFLAELLEAGKVVPVIDGR
jgi:NADPH:quinone reductase-like Zn-dependent oxidoreductase